MNIGENDWLAREYKREGRTITPQAAKKLAREHMLDCDARGIRVRHAMDCEAKQVQNQSRSRARRDKAASLRRLGQGQGSSLNRLMSQLRELLDLTK